MGDSCSWFGPLRRCASAAPQPSRFLVDDADRHVEETHLPISVLGFLDGNRFTNESAADVDEVATPFDLAVGADLAYRGFGWIVWLWKPPWHRTRRGLIDAGRWALAKRLVRPFFVVVARKCREATGLRDLGWRRWPHGFQKREVKTLVSAVLLRMARINPFMADAKLDPPYRQRRQTRGPGRGERRAVVGADYLRQAVLAKRPLQRRLALSILRAARRRQANQIAAEAIGYRERFNARAVAQSNPALVIEGPYMIGMLRHRQLPHTRRRTSPNPTVANQSRSFENLACRRGRRPIDIPLASLKLAYDLARSPARPLKPQPHDRIHDVLRRRSPMHPRGVGAIRKPSSPFQPVAVQPFVTGLPTNLVAIAQLRHRPQSASLIRDETNPLVHCAALSPRHRLILPADRELSPIHPVYCVTYLSGLDRSHPSPARGEGRGFRDNSIVPLFCPTSQSASLAVCVSH